MRAGAVAGCWQGIVPESATALVKELFVPASRVEAAQREATQLAALDITQARTLHVRSHCIALFITAS